MNPMYGNMHQIAPNPMMQWQGTMQPTFQPMMGGFNNSGGAQMMHGYQQQGWGEPPQNSNTTQRKNSARNNRKNWDIPTLDLDGSTNRNGIGFNFFSALFFFSFFIYPY